MFYLFLLGVAAAGGLIYLFIAGMYPGLKEERFGVLEPLPPDLGKWQVDPESGAGKKAAADGKKLEVRFLYEEGGLLSSGKLLRQSRLRDGATNDIVEVLPDVPIKRRRIRQTTS